METIHVFLLLVLLNGERQGDDLFFRDVDSCAYYARVITTSSMTSRDQVTALCVPQEVENNDKLKVY